MLYQLGHALLHSDTGLKSAMSCLPCNGSSLVLLKSITQDIVTHLQLILRYATLTPSAISCKCHSKLCTKFFMSFEMANFPWLLQSTISKICKSVISLFICTQMEKENWSFVTRDLLSLLDSFCISSD